MIDIMRARGVTRVEEEIALAVVAYLALQKTAPKRFV